ncbi:MAG: peptidoglycan-binding protein [Solirubrobacteraceae bacterium]
MLVCSPAGALGKVSSPRSRASAASDTRRASRTARPTPKPHPRRAVGHPSRPRGELLAFGTGYSAIHGSSAVRRLQRRLMRLGYSPGRIDGRYGPLTEQAVSRFQTTYGMQVDGIAGPLTRAALASNQPVLHVGSGYARGGSPAVRRLQADLTAASYRPGPVDGRYGPLTERAVMRFQHAHHLQVDGIAGPQTLDHLERTVAGRPHHHPQRVRSRPGNTPRRSRPAPAVSNGAPGPTRAGSSPPRTGRRSAGSILWIIALVFLLVAGLGVALWRRQGRHGDGVAAPAGPDGNPPAGARGHDTRPQGVMHEPALDSAWIPKQAQLLAGETDDHGADQRAGAAALELGLALLRKGDREGARDALRRADERGHPEAAYALGVLLAETGDRAGAKDALRRADERGHRVAPFHLGVLLLEEGDHAGAEDSFGRADRRGHAGAACNLGVLLEQRGDQVGARDAYRRADARGHAVGAYNLGAMLEQEGYLAGAREAYRRADERGDSLGAYSLGVLLEWEGDRARAKDAYHRAEQRGSAKIARAARTALLELSETGDGGRKFGRPPEVQAASGPDSRARPPERQDNRT